MLVCSCNRICHHCIEAEVEERLEREPDARLSAARVYGALGHRPRCGGCFPLAEQLIEGKREKISLALGAGVPDKEPCCRRHIPAAREVADAMALWEE